MEELVAIHDESIGISAASDTACSGANLPTGGITIVRLVA